MRVWTTREIRYLVSMRRVTSIFSQILRLVQPRNYHLALVWYRVPTVTNQSTAISTPLKPLETKIWAISPLPTTASTNGVNSVKLPRASKTRTEVENSGYPVCTRMELPSCRGGTSRVPMRIVQPGFVVVCLREAIRRAITILGIVPGTLTRKNNKSPCGTRPFRFSL